MQFRSDFERISAYHSWSRGKYLDLYDRLPWKVITRNREASFGSIRNVHLHILAVYAGWLVWMFHRRSLAPVLKRLDPKNFQQVTSVAKLREFDRTIDRHMIAVSRTVSSAKLGRKLWFTSEGKRSAFTGEEGLWHMIEEDYLHRGEIICMLWQDDIEPPNTSYMRWHYEIDPKRYAYLPYRPPARPQRVNARTGRKIPRTRPSAAP
ncbi:MAG: DinB family protein [Thermoplasmata archaeon]